MMRDSLESIFGMKSHVDCSSIFSVDQFFIEELCVQASTNQQTKQHVKQAQGILISDFLHTYLDIEISKEKVQVPLIELTKSQSKEFE